MQELTYTQVGDYLLPDIQLEVTERRELGKYGRMRRAFLKEHRSPTYSHMVLRETLFPHLWEVDETAERRMDQLMKELEEQNPPPDRNRDPLAWAAHMSSLQAQAEEIVTRELIYV